MSLEVIFWAHTLSSDAHRSRKRGGAPEPRVKAGGPGWQAPRAEVSRLLAAALSQSCGTEASVVPTKIVLWLVPGGRGLEGEL